MKATHDVDVVPPPSAPGALRMSGCEPGCPVPCPSEDHAVRASSASCRAPFPFEPSALLVYSSSDASDHIMLKVTVLVPGL